MSPDGTGVTRLTTWLVDERIATGAPGNKITFSSTKNGNEDIFIMDEDGSNITLLVGTEEMSSMPFGHPMANFLPLLPILPEYVKFTWPTARERS